MARKLTLITGGCVGSGAWTGPPGSSGPPPHMTPARRGPAPDAPDRRPAHAVRAP